MINELDRKKKQLTTKDEEEELRNNNKTIDIVESKHMGTSSKLMVHKKQTAEKRPEDTHNQRRDN